MVKIRTATLQDVQALRLLEKELINHERNLISAIKEGEDVKYQDIRKLIEDTENTRLLVMENDGTVIACGFAQLRRNAEYYKEEIFGYIGMMSVSSLHRGKGFGGDIIKELLKWLKTKNITEVKLKVFSNNTGAIKAYRKLGFTD